MDVLFGEDRTEAENREKILDEIIEFSVQQQSEILSQVYANCWHLSEVESAGMWSQYTQRDAGISIRCTYSKIQLLLGGDFGIGLINYLDDAEFQDGVSGVNTYMRKRISFSHEREVRAVRAMKSKDEHLPMPGFWQLVDLNDLIDEIVLAPTVPEWLLADLKHLLEKYELAVPVSKSELFNNPFPSSIKD